MYYKIKTILEENLPNKVGVIEIANILKAHYKEHAIDKENIDALLPATHSNGIKKLLRPENSLVPKKPHDKKKFSKQYVLDNLYLWFYLPSDYVLTREAINGFNENNKGILKEYLLNSQELILSLTIDELVALTSTEKYEAYKVILSNEKYLEYCTRVKENSNDISFGELLIKDGQFFNSFKDKYQQLLSSYTFYLKEDINIDFFGKFSSHYTKEDYQILKHITGKVHIKDITNTLIEKYNNYIEYDTNIVYFLTEYANVTNKDLFDHDKILNHESFNKLNIETKILFFGATYLIKNKLYKKVELQKLINVTNYHLFSTVEQKYFNNYGLLNNDLVDLIGYEKLLKNKNLSKELLNHLAINDYKLDLSLIKTQFTYEDIALYPNLEYSILNTKLSIKTLEQNEINYAKLAPIVAAKSKKLYAEFVKVAEVNQVIELLKYIEFNPEDYSNNTLEKLLEFDIKYLYLMIDAGIKNRRLYKKYQKLVSEYNLDIYTSIFEEKSHKEDEEIDNSGGDLLEDIDVSQEESKIEVTKTGNTITYSKPINNQYNYLDECNDKREDDYHNNYVEEVEIITLNDNSTIEAIKVGKTTSYFKYQDELIEEEPEVVYEIVQTKVGNKITFSKNPINNIGNNSEYDEVASLDNEELLELKAKGVVFIKRTELDALSYIDFNTSLIALRNTYSMFEDATINDKLIDVDFRDIQLAGSLCMVYGKAIREMIELFEHQLHCYLNYQFKYHWTEEIKTFLLTYVLGRSGEVVTSKEYFFNEASLGDLINVYNRLFAHDNKFIGRINKHISDTRNKVYHHSFILEKSREIYSSGRYINYIAEHKYSNEEMNYFLSSTHCQEIVELLNLCYYFVSRTEHLIYRKKQFHEDIVKYVAVCIEYYDKMDKIDYWVYFHMKTILTTAEQLYEFNFKSLEENSQEAVITS